FKMARVTPEEFQEKHARRLKGAVEDIRRGVERVTESPTAKAAAKKTKMKTNLNAAIDSGKWERGLKRVSVDEWKKKTVEKGIDRIAAGIDAAADKQVAFARELLPFIDTQKEGIKKLPDVTLEDNITRMTTFIRGMAKFERKG
ncbi:MAG: hypothetical protein HWN68_11095, partial [Desulfobacterales bacterium]|nr:hypothetical protein [Desulfobacterales bacterium]